MMGTDVITGLHHIAILCSKRDASLRFYDTLGFTLREAHARPERGDEVIMMNGHGITLELFVSSGNPQRVSSPEAYGLRHLALRAEDVQAVHEKLVDAGWNPEPLRTDTFDGKPLFFVKDPDGLPIEIHE